MLLINSLPSYLTRGHTFEPGTSLTDDIHPSIIVLQYSISVFTGDYTYSFTVHWDMESPIWNRRDHTKLKDLKRYYNWSMSYRLDSNFPVPYGSITKIAPEPQENDLGKTKNL